MPHPRLLLSGTGEDDDGNAPEMMEPGAISYLQPGEHVKGVGMERPGREFTPFVILSCLPYYNVELLRRVLVPQATT